MRPDNKLDLCSKTLLVALGIFLSLSILEISLRVAESFILGLQERKNLLALSHENSYRILCIGESTTQTGGDISYPSQLEKILNQGGGARRYAVINGGVVGIDTTGLVARLEEEIDKYKPRIIVAMMGINDQLVQKFKPPLQSPSALRFIYGLKTYKLARLVAMHAYSRFHHPAGYSGLRAGEQPDYRRMEEGYLDGISRAPLDSKAYKGLGAVYIDQSRFKESQKVLLKAFELDPGDREISSMLSFSAHCLAELDLARKYAEKAIAIDPEYYFGYLDLASILRDQKDFAQAGEILRKAVVLRPEGAEGYCELAIVYRFSGKTREAEEYFKKALVLDPDYEKAAAGLASLYEFTGNLQESRNFFATAQRLRHEKFGAVTAANFLKLRETALRRGILLVIAQYPMRPIQPLKSLFSDTRGLFFVDNEASFKDAVRSYGFDKYFRDMFAGDFGHCTAEGNKLLAGNIAKVIITAVDAKE